MCMHIGSRIYYDKTTGDVIMMVTEREGYVTPTTVEQDIEKFTVLSERIRTSFDCVDLAFGQFASDFRECTSYRVNPETKDLEFSYTDPNETESEPEYVYQKPLSMQVKELEVAQAETNTNLLELMEFVLLGGM